MVLYNQFKFFFNMFFLVNALTQLIEVLRVGLFITYIGPLIMVLSLTMAKEAYDDFNTYKRDIQVASHLSRPILENTKSPREVAGKRSKARTSKSETLLKWRVATGYLPI